MDSRASKRLGALSIFTLIFAAASMLPSADATHGGAGHVCPQCASAQLQAQALAQLQAQMPQPEAYPTPAATQAAPNVRFGASTVRLRATVYQVYRFGARGKLLEQRTIRLAGPRVWRSAPETSAFGTGRYVKLTSGPYSGWFLPAGSTVSAATTMFSPDLTVNVRAGRLVARQFFGPMVTRRVATLSAVTAFKSSRRAVFNNATHYLIENGPLAGRWVAASRIIIPSANNSQKATPAPEAAPTAQPTANPTSQPTANPTVQPTAAPTVNPTIAPAAGPVITWKAAVLLYRETDVTFKRADGTDYRLVARMDDTMYKLVRKTLGQFADGVATWSGGLAAMDMTIIDMPAPLSRVDPLGSSYWVSPASIQADMDKYAPKGKYDSVFVMYHNKDAKGVSMPIGGWGLTIPDGSWSNNTGFSSIVTPHELWWWTSSPAPEEVFMHEWMHQVIFFHERFGRTSLDLHAGDRYGYKDTNGSWKTWLMHVMQGKVKDGNKMLGVSADIWAAGKPSTP